VRVLSTAPSRGKHRRFGSFGRGVRGCRRRRLAASPDPVQCSDTFTELAAERTLVGKGLSSMFRWGWLVFGIVWGICLGDAARYSNKNYAAIKATMDGLGAGAPYGPLILLFAAVSLVLLALLLIVGLIALRRKPGFWSLMIGVMAGIGGSGAMQRIYQAIW